MITSDTLKDMRRILDTARSEKDKQVFERITSMIALYSGNHETIYWYPLENINNIIPAVAYDLDKIYKAGFVSSIVEVLKKCNIRFAHSFQMQFESLKKTQIDLISKLFEKDSDGFSFPWEVETYYYDDSESWMIYISHEGTITFTGKEKVDTAKREIKEIYLANYR